MRLLSPSVLLLSVALAMPIALAGDADLDGIPDDLEVQIQRAISGRALPQDEPTALYVVSTAPGSANPDAFEVDWARGTLTVSYLPDPSGPRAAHIALTLVTLVEFADLDDNGEVGPEEVVSRVDLRQGPYAPGRFTETDLPDGGRLLRFETGVGPVGVVIHISNTFTRTSSGVALAPTEVALELSAPDYRPREPGSALAIETELGIDPTASLGIISEPGASGGSAYLGGVTVMVDDENLYAAWDSGGVEGTLDTPDQAEDPWGLTLSMPASKELVVRVGVVSDAFGGEPPTRKSAPAGSGTSALVYGVTLGAVAALIGATTYTRRRFAR